MTLILDINGERRELDVPASTPLVQVLRETLGLRGTKLGCGNGECGACTVLIDDAAVCSCLLPAYRAEGHAVTTIEGLARDGELTPLQQAFVEHGATQCGFCTPGMIMSAHALISRLPRPTERDVVEGLAGNICRCTGYRQIIEAVLSVGRRTAA
ncbi:MAG: (2Fe-2S)-binding protein [Variibacter sp.]|nr:(2Fe-2S)-binding protein [Variibacter sp.]